MVKSPLAARGDFISLSRECKNYFRTKAKKQRAPKCPPLWSLAANEVRFHRTHFFLRSDYSRDAVTFCKPLCASGFRFRERIYFHNFDFATFDEKFDYIARRGEHVFEGDSERVFHWISRISKRQRIATFISCSLTFLLRFLVKNNFHARAEKTFFAKKLLTRKKTYVTIYRPLGQGGFYLIFLRLQAFFSNCSKKSEAPKSLALSALRLANQPSRNPHSASH